MIAVLWNQVHLGVRSMAAWKVIQWKLLAVNIVGTTYLYLPSNELYLPGVANIVNKSYSQFKHATNVTKMLKQPNVAQF